MPLGPPNAAIHGTDNGDLDAEAAVGIKHAAFVAEELKAATVVGVVAAAAGRRSWREPCR